MEQQIITMLEQSIQTKAGTLASDQELTELNGWDSMGMVMLVGEVYDHLEVELAVDELAACRTVGDLVQLVVGKSSA